MQTDAAEIERAFTRHRGEIYRYLLRRTRNRDDAEELTQQVFADAVSALARSRPPRSMRGWLYAVAERRFVDEVRRRSRTRSVVDAVTVDLDATDEPTDELERAMHRLPEPQRRIVVMRFVEGRSYPDIARELGCNEAACKMRLSRALRRLRADLDSSV